MNAIPLINNAPRPNINVGSVGSPAFNPVAAGAKLGGSIGGNVMRQNPASMPVNNETQLRQEINTSLVALKKEAFSLETLIAQAAQTLVNINNRIEDLEGKQGDYVKKSDVVDSITSGNMNPLTSNAVANSNAMPVNSVTSGNMHSVTSNGVYSALLNYVQAVSKTNPTITKNLTNSVDNIVCNSNYGVAEIFSKMNNESILFSYAQMLKDRPYPRDGFVFLFRIDSSFGGAFYFANGGSIYYTYNDAQTWTSWRQI